MRGSVLADVVAPTDASIDRNRQREELRAQRVQQMLGDSRVPVVPAKQRPQPNRTAKTECIDVEEFNKRPWRAVEKRAKHEEEPELRLLATKDEYIVARSVGKYEEGARAKRVKRGTPMGIETASSSSAREIVPRLDEEGDEDF